MNPIQPLFEFGQELLFGLLMMGMVLVFSGYLYSTAMLLHAKTVAFVKTQSSVLTTIIFVIFVLMLAIVQIFAICIWAAGVHLIGLIPDIQKAILFSGSCFTTIGIYPDLLPNAWKSIPLFIAFSGLFSFAWASSIMMSMASSMRKDLGF